MAEKKKERLALADKETWGERVHRAYRHGRSIYRYTYQQIADRMTAAGVPVADQTLMRYEQLEERPTNPRVRQICYWMLVAYGYHPEDFGLHEGNTPLDAYDVDRLTSLLAPQMAEPGNTQSRCIASASPQPKAKKAA